MDTARENAHDNPIAARQALAGTIAEQLQRQGYYLAHLDSEGQELIDLEWAALVAGRALGRKLATCVGSVGKREPGRVTVVVGPREPSAQRTSSDHLGRLDDAVSHSV